MAELITSLVGIIFLVTFVFILAVVAFVVLLTGGILGKTFSSLAEQTEQIQNQWEEAASGLGLQFQPGQGGLSGGSPSGLTLEGTHRGYDVIAYTESEDTGQVMKPHGSSASPSPVKRTVQRYVMKLGRDVSGGLVLTADDDMSKGDRFELNEFDTGDAGFDQAYVKSAHDQEEATAVLSQRQLRSALTTLAGEVERVQLGDGTLKVKSGQVRQSKDELRQDLDRLADIADMLDSEAADAASSSGDEVAW